MKLALTQSHSHDKAFEFFQNFFKKTGCKSYSGVTYIYEPPISMNQ
ncbi:hypothetical protein HPL003_09830 [Paenibacillus terrae HPL-003]|uniref:Uncharacterized protein n=1 Tax=Paenibacillus terrae (strain HPL-003) TaxID=985665 RepID=G7W3W7_PAETH|nr:hypothetical protein HPL003_09830 [Paenibacillus terrae HPL-003]